MLEKIKYKNEQLYFDDININEIAKNYETPTYIYSKNRIIENYRSYDDNFKKYEIKNYDICYAIKANENLTILKFLASMGAGADTVSGNEIKKAIIAGILPEKIVFSGVSKSEKELEYAIEQNIGQINIESYEEFLNIKKVANLLNKIANVSVRINPDIDAETHEKITTGKKQNKFGVKIEVAKKIIEEANKDKFLNFKGLSVHIGSQILKIEKFEIVLQYLKKIYNDFPKFTSIDLGGGIGIQYKENDEVPSRDIFVSWIKKYFGDFEGKIIIEPGRSIIGDSGIFLTEIMYTKETEEKNFIMVNGGMNALIRPALYDAYHHPLLVNITTNEKKKYDIVGPICESGDVFVKDIEFNKPKGKNYVVLLSAGAYGRSMSSNYNLHNLLGELWIEDGELKQIRKPISFEDLLKFEI